MSKNLTRKGLAFGAIVALGSTLLAGAPASALGLADNSFVSLAPTTGTAYTVLAGAGKTFSLSANEASTVVGGDVKFLVSDASGVVESTSASTGRSIAVPTTATFARVVTTGVVTVTVANDLVAGDRIVIPAAFTNANGTVTAGTYTVGTASSTAFTITDTTDVTAAASAVLSNAKTVTVAREARNTTNNTFVVDSGSASAASSSTVVLSTTESTVVSRSVDVTAWVDSNDNDLVDSTEYASPTRTVKFIKGSEVTATTTIDPIIVGLTTVVAHVTTVPVFNGQQMSADSVDATMTFQGSAVEVDGASVFNVDTNQWDVTGTNPASALNAAGAYSVRAKIGADYIQAAATSGSAATVTALTGAAAIAQSANITTVVTSGAAVATLRAKTLAASATWTFKDTYLVAVTAGRPVKVTVTTVTGVTGLKINGTAAAAGDVIDLATDAAGSVTAALTTTAAVATNSVVLTAVAEGVAGTSKTATFNWSDGTNTLNDLNATSSVYRSIAKGGSYTFNFAVTDSWKQVVAGDYRLKVAASGNTVSETYPSIATGTASVTVTDAQISSTGDITVVVTPQKKQTDGTWATTGAPAAVTYYLKPVAQTGAKVTAVTAGASVDFLTTAVVAGDSRNSQAAVTGDGTAGTDAVEVTGVVTNALTGVPVSGAAVTISGAADLLFIDGAKASLGSIVVYAADNGTYSVNVRSNKAAVDTLVTASALGASSTALKITFLKAKNDTGTALTITAPATAIAGSTITVTVSLKDAFGNAVVTDSTATGYIDGATVTAPTTKVTYTGPGFVTSTIPSVTDADGNIKFVVLLGANDKGTATVSAAYDSNGATTNVAGTTLVASATATITLGADAAAAASTKAGAVVASKNGRVYVTVNNAAGFKSSVKVGFSVKPSFRASSASQLVSYFVGAGKRVAVVVSVRGGIVASQAITIK